MNLTVCQRDGQPGKVIRNWDKACRVCEHCRLVAVQVFPIGGQRTLEFALYLFQCPYVAMRHKAIGADTHRSQPRRRIDLVRAGFYLKCGQREIDAFNWQEYERPLDRCGRMEIAEIPRDRWEELIY